MDKNGFPSSIGPRGVRIMVTPFDPLADGANGVTSPRKKNSSAAKKDLCKKATHNPQITMPKFSLDLKIQGDLQRSGGGGSASKATERAEQERAARIAREGVALQVRAEASDLDIAGVSVGSLACAGVRAAVFGDAWSHRVHACV